jgi:hypothetical protein
MMMEMQVTLDFRCCVCDHSVTVTVLCAGPGLFAEARPKAAVDVPCPSCHSVNKLIFDPNGTVHAVAPYRAPRQLLEPSIN